MSTLTAPLICKRPWTSVSDAKVQRPGVCNAMETLLVHAQAADTFMPEMVQAFGQAGVELRWMRQIPFPMRRDMLPAQEEDWHAEYLNLTLAVKIVSSMQEAMDHIATYGSDHTDVIVTTDMDRAETFVRHVASSMVGVNASTRFNDGGQLGSGCGDRYLHLPAPCLWVPWVLRNSLPPNSWSGGQAKSGNRWGSMKSGLYGGTFNPFHNGHLKVITHVQKTFAMDRIHLIPSATPPHKTLSSLASARDRLEMIQRSVARLPGLQASDLEIRRPGPSFTVDTVRQFKAASPPGTALYFILGTDAFFEMDTWKSPMKFSGVSPSSS